MQRDNKLYIFTVDMSRVIITFIIICLTFPLSTEEKQSYCNSLTHWVIYRDGWEGGLDGFGCMWLPANVKIKSVNSCVKYFTMSPLELVKPKTKEDTTSFPFLGNIIPNYEDSYSHEGHG